MMILLKLCVMFGALASLLCAAAGSSSVDGKPRRCVRSKLHGKVVQDCHGMDLTVIPQDLRSDVQALDVSFNRLRELPSGCFARYTSVELLYLGDNAIAYIDDDVFEPLQSLQVVDLSLNAIQMVPAPLLAISSLWKLDMSQNKLSADGLDAFRGSTLSENLKWLSLAQCHLMELPLLDAFPLLLHLNVSGNELLNFSTAQLAPACSLKTLDLNKVHIEFSHCDCFTLHHWSQEDGIKILPDNKLNDCNLVTVVTTMPCMQDAEDARRECKKSVIAKVEKAKMDKIWIIVGVVAAGVTGTVFLVFFCLRRRRNKRVVNQQSGNNNNMNGNNGKRTLDQCENKLLNFSTSD